MNNRRIFYSVLSLAAAGIIGLTGCGSEESAGKEKQKKTIESAVAENKLVKYEEKGKEETQLGALDKMEDSKDDFGFGVLEMKKQDFNTGKVNEFIYRDIDRMNFDKYIYLIDFGDGTGVELKKNSEGIKLIYGPLNAELAKELKNPKEKGAYSLKLGTVLDRAYESITYDPDEEKYIEDKVFLEEGSVLKQFIDLQNGGVQSGAEQN